MFSLTEPTLAEMGVSRIGDRLFLVDCLQSLYEADAHTCMHSPTRMHAVHAYIRISCVVQAHHTCICTVRNVCGTGTRSSRRGSRSESKRSQAKCASRCQHCLAAAGKLVVLAAAAMAVLVVPPAAAMAVLEGAVVRHHLC